jgi:hypothetical protein
VLFYADTCLYGCDWASVVNDCGEIDPEWELDSKQIVREQKVRCMCTFIVAICRILVCRATANIALLGVIEWELD